MGENAPFLIKLLLYPLSLIYGFIVIIRNKLFDIKILKSKEFRIPIISVGNITVGGTGKTPHIEYLVELLSPHYKVAVLSRGYKRKTRNFIIATENSPVSQIGDEPWQLKEKYPNIVVAVDRNRVRGIELLQKNIPDIDIILLDDAFQHRYVKPGISILLIDYSRPLEKDHILPYGRLREPAAERYRADLIILSKSPETVTPIDRRVLVKRLDLMANQHAFFTSIVYGDLKPLLASDESSVPLSNIQAGEYSVLLVTGIANPAPMKEKISRYTTKLKVMAFPDHHRFTENDIHKVQDEFSKLEGENRMIITTEKDVPRLKEFASVNTNAEHWYYLPIKMEFHTGEAEVFNKYILHYVTNNNRNSLLFKK